MLRKSFTSSDEGNLTTAEKAGAVLQTSPLLDDFSDTDRDNMSDTKKKVHGRRIGSSNLLSYIYQLTYRFKILFGQGVTTYTNSKLILRMLSASQTVHKKSKRDLWKLFILRIFLLVLTVGLDIGISYPMKWYSTALNERKEEDFWHFLKVFVVLVCITAPIYAANSYIRALLSMRFRQTLTNMLFDLYMTKRAYYHLRWKTEIDNPGQRFGDDIKKFANGLFDLLNVILKHVLNLLGFSYVLYTIDASSIPMLCIYSLCGTVFALTVFSQKLTVLSQKIMKDQADFITNIIHIHDSSESIALMNAAKHERNWLKMRFETLISDSISNMKWLAGLHFFNKMFHFLSIVVPYFLLAKKYFEKTIEFGELSQSLYAFSALLKALNIIINKIPTITALSATSSRVGDAITTVYNIHTEHKDNNNIDDSERTQLLQNINREGISSSKIMTKETRENVLKLDNISYFAPKSDYLLLHQLNLVLNNNKSLLIVGYSGCGKSSLLRVISGLWNYGSGKITRPKLKYCLFLPQKPYIPSLPLEFNTLRNQLLFPKYLDDEININNITCTATQLQCHGSDDEITASCIDDKDILNVLERINLTHLDTYSSGHGHNTESLNALLYCKADWVNCLSVGEQQRLAIGRCLISKPSIVFADEATSALDSVNEELMYKQLKEMNVSLVSVGHHKELARFHDFVLQFQKDGKWELLDSKQFMN